MKPKDVFIKRAIANGSVERLNILLSAAHILNCAANQYAEEAADLMAENGLLLGRLKQLHNNFIKSAICIFVNLPEWYLMTKRKWRCFRTWTVLMRCFVPGQR